MKSRQQFTGSLYCRPEMKGKSIARTSRRWCSICKKKIRSKNHVNGTHHKLAS